MHGEAAEHIEAAAGRAADEAAELLSASSPLPRACLERALHFSEVAADRARADLAPVEAAAFYRRALEATRRLDGGMWVRARLEESLAGVLEQSGLYAEARARPAGATLGTPIPRPGEAAARGRADRGGVRPLLARARPLHPGDTCGHADP